MTTLNAWQLAEQGGHACILFFANPLVYIATLLLIVDLVRNIRAERAFFGIRVTRIWKPFCFRYLVAVCVGLALSVVAVLLGIQVDVAEIAVVSGLSIVLAAARLRWLASSTAIALVSLSAIVEQSLFAQYTARLGQIGVFLHQFHVIDWVALLGLGAIGELVLFVAYRKSSPSPALVASRRGRSLGAFKLQLGFVIPVAVLVPGPVAAPHVPVDWPWLTSHAALLGLAGLPMVVGAHFLSCAVEPQVLLRRKFVDSLATAILAVAGVYALSTRYGWLSVIPVTIALLWPEWRVRQFHWQENHADPVCPPNSDGVVVLHTIRGSLAESMGLKPGEVITHVNQVPVHTEFDLHFAIDQNPAYAKLQVVDRRGEIRLVGKPVYEGERHQLGIIFVPQQLESACYAKRSFGLLQTLYIRWNQTSGTTQESTGSTVSV